MTNKEKPFRMKADFVPMIGEWLKENPYGETNIKIPFIYPDYSTARKEWLSGKEIMARSELGPLDKAGISDLVPSPLFSKISSIGAIENYKKLRGSLAQRELNNPKSNLIKFLSHLAGIGLENKENEVKEKNRQKKLMRAIIQKFSEDIEYSFWEFLLDLIELCILILFQINFLLQPPSLYLEGWECKYFKTIKKL